MSNTYLRNGHLTRKTTSFSDITQRASVAMAHVALFKHLLHMLPQRYQASMRRFPLDCVIPTYCHVKPLICLQFTFPSHVSVPQECYLPQFLVKLIEYFQLYFWYIYRECAKRVWASFGDLRWRNHDT